MNSFLVAYSPSIFPPSSRRLGCIKRTMWLGSLQMVRSLLNSVMILYQMLPALPLYHGIDGIICGNLRCHLMSTSSYGSCIIMYFLRDPSFKKELTLLVIRACVLDDSLMKPQVICCSTSLLLSVWNSLLKWWKTQTGLPSTISSSSWYTSST